ncbi:MAG TPA: 50S ribosomal protein L15 [Anaerolineae bacterium]|nr:50S ribosomal protein L15 [Caldilineae bacterium]HID35291.1 50S ribosomal protein L15 [Anaerolineae bacterium]HIQ12188.1 50S ribosomal protein L15 [Caldilineales bacterium]
MNLHDLKPARGSRKRRTRVGRGIAAGKGKTAGRGVKGQKARSGGAKGPYFEGGQLPLFRRLPHIRGFHNINRIEYQLVNVGALAQDFQAGDEITPEILIARGYIRKNGGPVVILGDGEIDVALTVKAHRFSKSAQAKIEAAGGSVEILPLT